MDSTSDFYFKVAQRIPDFLKQLPGKAEDEDFVRLFCHSHYEPRPDIYGNLWLSVWLDDEKEALEYFTKYRRDLYNAVAADRFFCGYILEFGNIIDRYFICQIPTANASLLGTNLTRSMA
jgi:hypothetical protein